MTAKPPSKRALLESLFRVAGYHGDRAAYTRGLVDHRISQARAKALWLIGAAARKGGVPCSCSACRDGAAA